MSIGGTIWAPSAAYTLYPLSAGGLWLAVTITPAAASSCSHGEGEHWRRDDEPEPAGTDAESGEHGGGVLGEGGRTVAGVVPDDRRAGTGWRATVEQPPAEPRRRPPDERPVHPVGPGTDRPAEPGGAELEPGPEPLRQPGFVAGLQQGVDLGAGLGVGVLVPPGAGRRLQRRVHRSAAMATSRSAIRSAAACPAARTSA